MIRVILADDEQKICQLITKLIDWEGLGMELVGTARDGIATLQLIQEHRPDLVLTDIRMPGYDGLELIAKAREILPDLEFVIISGYSHFSYAQAAIRYGVSDYILKPVNRELLNTTLQKVKEKILHKAPVQTGALADPRRSEDIATLRASLLPELLSGNAMPSLEAVNERCRWTFAPGRFRCFLLGFGVTNLSNANAPYVAHLLDLVYSQMVSLFAQYMKPLCLDGELFHHQELLIGILNYPESNEEQVAEVERFLLGRLREEAGAVPDVQVYLAQGAVCADLTVLSASVPAARDLFSQRFLTPANHFITDKAADIVYDQDALYKPFSDEINRAMETVDPQVVEAAVRRLHTDAERMQLSGGQMLQAARDAYHMFVLSGMFHKGFQMPDRDAKEQTFYQSVRLCSDAKTLFALLEKTTMEHVQQAAGALSAERFRPIQQAISFMQSHYMEDIGLEEVSAAAGFSSSYFSTLFRRETGRGFLDYLTGLRMDHAKTLLREHQMSIEMVGKSVGLSDYKRFARTFKKEVGISPGEYRSLYGR